MTRASQIVSIFLALACSIIPPAHADTPWAQPASQLSAQIATITGAGQAQLTVTNRSTIAATDLPAIRRLLEADLHAHGVLVSGSESANQIRITLSENTRERLWVAEIVEGNESHVTMVHFARESVIAPHAEATMVLQKKQLWAAPASDQPVLQILETRTGLIILERDQIVIGNITATGWVEKKRVPLTGQRTLSRDARGTLILSTDGNSFTAYAPGTECTGAYSTDNSDWTIRCHESDDPWPISPTSRAFFNPARNYFTGVLSPTSGVDLPPFYSIASLPRPNSDHPALLVSAIDGKVLLAETGRLTPVSGARDWGSDFAAVRTGCASGTQVIASNSGEAEHDSLRAYEIFDGANPASAPLEMNGTVTALWTATDGASAIAVVRTNANQTTQYEVDRVTAICP